MKKRTSWRCTSISSTWAAAATASRPRPRNISGKDVSELSLAECASLAGITNNPSLYSPNSSVEVTRYQCSSCEFWTNTQTNACPNCGEVGTLGEGVVWTAKDYNKARQETFWPRCWMPTAPMV